MTRARDLQIAAWDAECRHDLVALLGFFQPDAVFHPAGGPPQQGHAAIQAMTEDFYGSYPELQIEVLGEWGDGEASAVFEFRAHLTAADGEHSILDGVCVVHIDGDRFASVRYYEDAPVAVRG